MRYKQLLMNLSKYVSFKSRIFNIALLLLVFLIIAVPVLANSQSWSFTMDQRYLRGVDRTMTQGTMTNEGDIWVYKKLVGAVGPLDVHIRVFKNIPLLPDPMMCYIAIKPSAVLNVKKHFNMPCGSASAGNYYLEISKTNVDGYYIKGSGTLSTR